MQRDMEKFMIELDAAIRSNEERDNTFTLSVLQETKDILQGLFEDPWIPVTKLLPEMFETVQITAKMPADTDSLVYQGAMVGKDKWELDGVGNPEDYKVTAWKPLPEPYKGE